MARTAARSSDSGSRAETHKERVDRELIELLNELRVALPGVQFLFAFLLIVPFQQTRDQLTDFQKDLYFVSLLAAAVATVLLIAPAAQHRVLFRQKDKDQLLRRSNVYASTGLVVLGLAICTAILLVLDVLFSATLGWVSAGVIAVLLAILWVVFPLWRRAHTEQDDADDDVDV
jgi:O-antigen/teichoic acid export membrane protein